MGPGLVPVNDQRYQLFIGFAIYSFEGIGVVMPIMHSCSEPKKFNQILILAICTLLAAFLFFGTFGYITYGSNMNE